MVAKFPLWLPVMVTLCSMVVFSIAPTQGDRVTGMYGIAFGLCWMLIKITA